MLCVPDPDCADPTNKLACGWRVRFEERLGPLGLSVFAYFFKLHLACLKVLHKAFATGGHGEHLAQTLVLGSGSSEPMKLVREADPRSMPWSRCRTSVGIQQAERLPRLIYGTVSYSDTENPRALL